MGLTRGLNNCYSLRNRPSVVKLTTAANAHKEPVRILAERISTGAAALHSVRVAPIMKLTTKMPKKIRSRRQRVSSANPVSRTIQTRYVPAVQRSWGQS